MNINNKIKENYLKSIELEGGSLLDLVIKYGTCRDDDEINKLNKEAREWFNEQPRHYRLRIYIAQGLSLIYYKLIPTPNEISTIKRLMNVAFKPLPSPKELNKKWEESNSGNYV